MPKAINITEGVFNAYNPFVEEGKSPEIYKVKGELLEAVSLNVVFEHSYNFPNVVADDLLTKGAQQYLAETGKTMNSFVQVIDANEKTIFFDAEFWDWMRAKAIKMNEITDEGKEASKFFEELHYVDYGRADLTYTLNSDQNYASNGQWIDFPEMKASEVKQTVYGIVNELQEFQSIQANNELMERAILVHEAAHHRLQGVLFSGLENKLLKLGPNLYKIIDGLKTAAANRFEEQYKSNLTPENELLNDEKVQRVIQEKHENWHPNARVRALAENIEFEYRQMAALSEAFAMIREVVKGVNEVTPAGVMFFKLRLMMLLAHLKRTNATLPSQLEGQLSSFTEGPYSGAMEAHDLGFLTILSKGNIIDETESDTCTYQLDSIASPTQIWKLAQEFLADPVNYLESISLPVVSKLIEQRTGESLARQIDNLSELAALTNDGSEINSEFKDLQAVDFVALRVDLEK